MIKNIITRTLRLLIRITNKIAKQFNYSILAIKLNNGKSGLPYEHVTPGGGYAPWLVDTSFNEIYRKIKDYTMVDKYRCYELWQLVQESAKLTGAGALIEIGVWRGGTGALIAKKAQEIGISDTVYLCDTFTGVVKVGKKDLFYKGGEHNDTSDSIVTNLTSELRLDKVKILKGVFPDETAQLIDQDKFRFCHIDVDIYKSAKDIVEWIWPRLSVGGIIVYDDYGFESCSGITAFVNEERTKKDRVVIHNLNGHAVVIKIM